MSDGDSPAPAGADRRKRIKVDFVAQQLADLERDVGLGVPGAAAEWERLAYVREWLSGGVWEAYHDAPGWRTILNNKELKKEAAEAQAVVRRVEGLVEECCGGDYSRAVVFDVCCGKGYLGATLAVRHADLRVFLADRNRHINFSYLDGLPNARSSVGDILKPGDWLARYVLTQVAALGGRVTTPFVPLDGREGGAHTTRGPGAGPTRRQRETAEYNQRKLERKLGMVSEQKLNSISQEISPKASKDVSPKDSLQVYQEVSLETSEEMKVTPEISLETSQEIKVTPEISLETSKEIKVIPKVSFETTQEITTRANKDKSVKTMTFPDGKPLFVIIVGIHLCGFLSDKLVETFNGIDEVCGLVLSPCCIASHKVSDTAARSRRMMSTGTIDNYVCWSLTLYHSVDAACRRDLVEDPLMLSKKNRIIVARKEPRLVSPPAQTQEGGQTAE